MNIHALSGILTHDPSIQVDSDLHLRLHGHLEWLCDQSECIHYHIYCALIHV